MMKYNILWRKRVAEGKMTLEEALKEIDRLKAMNTALRKTGKVNRETKN